MSMITILPVRNRRERRIFLTFPWRIFKDDPLWVPPLLPDLEERIDPRRGVFFQHGGDAEYFIAWRDGKPVGTISAAEDRFANASTGNRECIFGFFHFIQDEQVMHALLEHVKDWARRRGLVTISGPFNLDYEDSYGILVEGRDRPPALMCGHTPPYYYDFIERANLWPARGDNIAFALDLTAPNPALDELSRMAARVRQHGRFTIRAGRMEQWEEELERIYTLLNIALTHLTDYRPWPREVVFNSLAQFRKIADPELVLFAECKGETIGWLPGLSNLNEAFIHANGLRYPWDYLKLAFYLRRKTKCLTIKSALVLPEYWGSGVAALMFDEMLQRARSRGYQWIDASITSDDNPRTPALGKRFGAQVYKRYRVYRGKTGSEEK
ncbi:MAG: GNAT family N-acetyltransferase [Anaerolineaceae bacterium]|jgi:GNAT superfamily N-acetyltransferase